jgi:ATP-dependent DNA ligase
MVRFDLTYTRNARERLQKREAVRLALVADMSRGQMPKFWYFIAMAKSARANRTGTIPAHQRAGLAPPPAWIKPQLAKLVSEAPDGPDWLHEIKFDGYRMHARIDAGKSKP